MRVSIDVNVISDGVGGNHIYGDIEFPSAAPEKVNKLLDRLMSALESIESAADAQRHLADRQGEAVHASVDALETIAETNKTLARG